MQMLLGLVLVSTFSLSAWATRSCEDQMFQVAVLEEGVNPPGAHGSKLMDLIKAEGHTLASRDGDTFWIRTRNPDDLMRTLSSPQAPAITQIKTAQGSEVSLYGSIENSFNAYTLGDQRKALFNLMRDLPEGRYNLKKSNAAGGDWATMFVDYKQNIPFGASRHTIAMRINVFEGSKAIPDGDDKAIAYFTNSTGAVDSWSVHELENVKGYDLDCSLPYGHGYSVMSLHIFETINFSTVIIKGETYRITGFAPIQRFRK